MGTSGRNFAKHEGGEGRFFHRNALGSVGTVTRYDGLVMQAETFYPWGQKWNSVGTLTSEQFAATQPRDTDTGLDATPYRMYTSGYGRWRPARSNCPHESGGAVRQTEEI